MVKGGSVAAKAPPSAPVSANPLSELSFLVAAEVAKQVAAVRADLEKAIADVRVALAGGVFKAVHIRGDFFAAERAIVALETALRWRPVERGAVREALSNVGPEVREGLALSSLEGLEDAVPLAAAAASRPYGCFVAPGASSGSPP